MRQFQGVITPLITPFRDDGAFYVQGMGNLISFLAERGVHGVFAVGSYGQFPLMNVEERMEVAEVVISEAKGHGMQVIVQVGSPGQKEALDLARHAAGAGADAVASVVPFYYSHIGYDENVILGHYQALVDSVDVPVHFYVNPTTTGYKLTVDTLSKLIDLGVMGIKDSGKDVVSFGENMNLVNRKRPEFDLMPGSASVLLAGMLLGADACVAGTSAAFPELVVECYDAVRAGDYQRAGLLQLKILEARRIQGGAGLRAAACYDMLAMRGVDVGTSRRPWPRWGPEEKEVAKRQVAESQIPFSSIGG
ncbi:dihydrodipicolinate synthase family protein [Gemmatimonadota bacterium]